MDSVTAQDIVAATRQLGIAAGDLLLVHGSLSSFGHVTGGAEAVAQALVEAVSPGGSVFVPTFTYGKAPFDPATTPSLNGAITEAVRRLPGAVRSAHPTHAVAGIGPAAAAVVRGHHRTLPFGLDSPLWRLWERKARVLLVGVDHRANSMIHVAEELLDMPYLDRTRVAPVVTADGSIEERVVRRGGCSAAFNRIDAPLRAAGQVREAQVGLTRLQLIDAADVVSTAVAMLRADPAALLCNRAECGVCETARHAIAGTP